MISFPGEEQVGFGGGGRGAIVLSGHVLFAEPKEHPLGGWASAVPVGTCWERA